MIKYLVIFCLIFTSIAGCTKKKKSFDIKILDCFTNYADIKMKYINLQVDSNGIFGEPKTGHVLQLEIFNNSKDSMCLDVQNFSKEFLNIKAIGFKSPMKINPNNWGLTILDNWGLENESCIQSNQSKIFLAMIDKSYFLKDSLNIKFSSSTLKRGLEWKIPRLKCDI